MMQGYNDELPGKSYTIKKKVQDSFADAVAKTKEALAREGFGILHEHDVQATLKKKIDAAIGGYVILGACNPPLARDALQLDKDVGVFLPCNVVVYEDEDAVVVAAVRPSAVMGSIGSSGIASIAQEVEEKLTRAVDNI